MATTSLGYLAWTSALCIVLWLPYVLERITSQGLIPVLSYEESDAEPAWAVRAHLNLLENLQTVNMQSSAHRQSDRPSMPSLNGRA